MRWVRAHAALREAAMRGAAELPLFDLSLASVAVAAGVSRSTAYEHASSARELVEEALLEELDAARDRYLATVGPAPTPHATLAMTREVIAHIERHSAIYRRGLAQDAGAGSLHGMLGRHFADTLRLLLDLRGVDPGIEAPDAAAQRAVDAIVMRGLADGTVGQISAWIAQPEPRDPELFILVSQQLLPDWWPRTQD